jgi:phage gp29-like protein
MTNLQIRQTQDGSLWYHTGALAERWVDTPNPLLEQTRRYYGRALTPEAIEQTIVMADNGYMRDLTDLTYEATRIDPHFSMCDGKRLRAVAAIKPKVIPAEGGGIDPARATLYADVVRQQIAWIPNWRQVLLRLNFAHKHGRGAAEKVWKQNPAGSQVKWRIDHINWIHPRRLSFGPDRELRVRDDLWGGYGFEPRGLALRDYPYKFLAFTPQLFDEYPEREGYGPRGLYFSFFKRFTTRERLILMEVFGRPWRIISALDGASLTTEQLTEAAKAIDAASANATGVAPKGTKIDTNQPGQGAGVVHKDILQDSDDQLSKLILGEVRTSDAKPGALGSSAEQVALEVQSEVKAQDCWNCSDLLTEQFARDVIALNYGNDALDHCPRIELPYEAPPDRTVEIERTTKAFSIGLPLKVDEVYERIGFTKPGPGDETVQQAPQAGLSGAPPAPEAEPTGQAPTPDASPLGNGGGDSPDANDQNSLTAGTPPDFLTLARAAHVLELTRYLGQPARVIRTKVPTPPTPKQE